MRRAWSWGDAALDAAEVAAQYQGELSLTVAELRAAMLDQFTGTIQQVAGLVAERTGRRPDDFQVRNLAGAVIGVSMAVLLTAAQEPTADWIALLARAFAHLEAGLPV